MALFKICECGCHCNLRWCESLNDVGWCCPECKTEYL